MTKYSRLVLLMVPLWASAAFAASSPEMPPLSVRVDVGGTGGSVVPCMPQGRRYVCGG